MIENKTHHQICGLLHGDLFQVHQSAIVNCDAHVAVVVGAEGRPGLGVLGEGVLTLLVTRGTGNDVNWSCRVIIWTTFARWA